MLVFLDESGDTGRKIGKGSSDYFIVSLVIFEDNGEALSCDQRIGLLRKELKYPENYEFHFADNSKRVRELFLQSVAPYHFTVFSVAINKDPTKLYGAGFDVKESFYKYACNMVFTNAKPYLDHATVIIDKSGSPTFISNLRKYLRDRMNDEKRVHIKKIKVQDSKTNNLIQLVDYVCGVTGRKLNAKADWKNYWKYISTKIIAEETWPK
jgi:hypothetical protein